MEKEFNFDLRLPANPPHTLTPELFKEFSTIYNSIKLLADQVAGGPMLEWNSFLANAALVGWSSLSISLLQYRYLNIDTILINYYLSGVSNSTLTSLSLPEMAKDSNYYSTSLNINNGVSATIPAQLILTAGSKVVQINRDLSGAAWTGSGTKSIAGQFIYRII